MEYIYTGREISWLDFNKRVLDQALALENPILERLKFLAIFSSNLDEYFMIRVSGMAGQVDLGLTSPDPKTSFMPLEYLEKMLKQSKKLVKQAYEIYNSNMEELSPTFLITKYQDLSEKHKLKMDGYFRNLVFPILTPIRFSSHLPFPLLPNLSNYLISKLESNNTQPVYSVVTVPKNVERCIKIKKNTYILLEDLIMNHIGSLYEGMKVEEVVPFRLTRDFDLDFNDQSDDFASSVMAELKNRKRGAAVRLEIDQNASEEISDFLQNHIKLNKKQIFKIDGPLDLTFLHEFIDNLSPYVPNGLYTPIDPIYPKSLLNKPSFFEVLRKKDVMLLHPHHSYKPVIELIEEASNDENVVAIKQTIYRTNKDSRIMDALVKAAESGKQVTVLFELKARFDEENNLYWGNILERAGAHVIYGVPTLKTHSKVLLIVRRTSNLVERFVHFSTGNYNEYNARIYTDISYFTSKKMIGDDATKFFNYISSFSKKPSYNKLIASPNSIRDKLNELIDQEIEFHKESQNGHIILKINSISDIKLINKLYFASQQGVKIDLIVRGICCIVPKVKGLSENIRVISIVGRYLEHMRIYYFNNNNKNNIYISSADLMTRNMENRIELALQVSDINIKTKLYKLLLLQLSDTVKAKENIEGTYHDIVSEEQIDSQMALYDLLSKKRRKS
jgi:polyphosphate kinase